MRRVAGAGEIHHRRRQRFLDGSAASVLAIAPLVQSRAAGVDQQCGFIPAQSELHLKGGAGFFKPADMIMAFQPLDDRFFDDGLAIRHAVQLGIQRPAFHRKRVPLTDPTLPRQRFHPFKQLLKAARRKRPHQQLDTLGIARADVRPCQHIGATGKQHPTIFHPHIAGIHPF